MQKALLHKDLEVFILSYHLSLAVVENLIGASEIEESSGAEDEATRGRKRIR